MDDFDKDKDDVPLSESNVTLKLALIQKRCSDLIEDDEDFGGLTIAEDTPAEVANDGSNPYDRG